MTDLFEVPDGLNELRDELPRITALIARTARWVHPDTFRALPVWYPEVARGQPTYDATWGKAYRNTNRTTGRVSEKLEPNVVAAKALIGALGTRRKYNWTVCHVWGVDDPKFQRSNNVVRDARFYSCVGNMVWLPTPLKGFTDCVPEVKWMLRTCVFHLYGWTCEHPDVVSQAAEVRSGAIPDWYPNVWPAPGRNILPPGTAPFSPRVKEAIAKRTSELRRKLSDTSLKHFPRKQVKDVLAFWKIEL
jgi:hypothetical protein